MIVPTSLGPIGGIVTEPEGEARAALVLLQGGGRGGRAGVNGVWTDVAHGFARLGVVVLRVDYAGDGESFVVGRERGDLTWKYETDLQLVTEATRWFRERAGAPELFVAGSCYGGRLAIDVAAADAATTQLLLVVPFLRAQKERLAWKERLKRVRRGASLEADGAAQIDPAVLEALGALSRRGSTWILLGDQDPRDAFELEGQLGAEAGSIEIDVVPGMALYPVHYPDIQAKVRARLIARVEQVLGA